jgi:hypothetical protein
LKHRGTKEAEVFRVVWRRKNCSGLFFVALGVRVLAYRYLSSRYWLTRVAD